PPPGRHVDNLNPLIGMIRVAQYALAFAIRRNVPRVVFRDGRDRARRPVHAAKRARPDRKDDIARRAQKCLMDDEFIVTVLVQALKPRAVTPYTMHTRRGVPRELDPLRLQRMKLRMNDSTRKRDRAPSGPVVPPNRQAGFRAAFVRGSQPFAVRTDGTFTQLCIREFENPPVASPQSPASRHDQRFAIRMQRRTERMQRRAIRQLSLLACFERRSPYLRVAAPVRREKHFPAARIKRALQ